MSILLSYMGMLRRLWPPTSQLFLDLPNPNVVLSREWLERLRSLTMDILLSQLALFYFRNWNVDLRVACPLYFLE